MFKKIKLPILSILIFSLLIAPQLVFAQSEIEDGFDILKKFAGFVDKDIREIAASLINQAIGLVGIILIAIIVIAGFKWMLSGGSEEKVAEARRTLVAAIIGTVIIFTSYSIANFVMDTLLKAT
ncbi:hypothetical protein ACFL2U_01695 [Patescibacteria group bacterium]